MFAELGLWCWSYGALAVVSFFFAIIVQRSFARTTGSGHDSPVPVASLIPLVLAITITQLIAFSITAGTLMAAGGESVVDSARYVTIGIAILTVLGIYADDVATKK